jgi:hypothetical protein
MSSAVFPCEVNLDDPNIEHTAYGRFYGYPDVANIVSHGFVARHPQNEVLKTAYSLGRQIGHPELVQAIAWKESKAIPNAVGQGAYGVMQVQVASARSVLKQNPDLIDEHFPNETYATLTNSDIRRALTDSTEANIAIAVTLLQQYIDIARGNLAKAIVGYNVGIGAASRMTNHSHHSYFNDVMRIQRQIIRPWNVKNSTFIF